MVSRYHFLFIFYSFLVFFYLDFLLSPQIVWAEQISSSSQNTLSVPSDQAKTPSSENPSEHLSNSSQKKINNKEQSQKTPRKRKNPPEQFTAHSPKKESTGKKNSSAKISREQELKSAEEEAIKKVGEHNRR